MKAPSCACVVGVLLLAVSSSAFVHDPLDPKLSWYKPFDRETFNFSAASTGPNYQQNLLDVVYRKVTAQSRNAAYSLPVLSKQTLKTKPYRWLMLELIGRGQDKIMLAVRQDNLYIAGFTDKAGTWYVFSNKEELHLIPGATKLPFRDNYQDLAGGYMNLASLKLGREPTLVAVQELANYNQARSNQAKRTVAVMAVTICEATRLKSINGTIVANWGSPTGLFIGDQAKVVVKWRIISCALMISVQNNNKWGPWSDHNREDEAEDLKSVKIINLNQAKAAVNLLLWPSSCSKRITWLK